MLGKRLYQKYLCTVRRKNGFLEKLKLVYDDYMKHVVTNERFIVNERQTWNALVQEKFAYMVLLKDTHSSGINISVSRIEVIDHGLTCKYYKSENFSMKLC